MNISVVKYIKNPGYDKKIKLTKNTYKWLKFYTMSA